ncbi:MAG: hypothetical protein U0324_44650 [Polyangiales bacterium]
MVRTEVETGGQGAAELDVAVFGGGGAIPFLKGAPHAVWTEAGKAIATLRGEGAAPVLARHHLTAHVDRVEAAHAVFGHTLGATGSLAPAPADRVRVRDALGACTAALCDYVIRACAVEDPARPGSDRLLSRLLAALESVPRVHERAPRAAANDDDGAVKGGGAPDNDDADATPEAPRKVG